MINIIYQRLFNLKITHTFFKSDIARGLILEPTSETTRLLKDGKMLLKYLSEDQLTVLYRGLDETPPVDPPKPFISLGKDFKMTFAMRAENKSEFLNITELNVGADKYTSGNILYFKNNPASAVDPEEITHSLIDTVRSSLFTYSFSRAAATGDVDFILVKIADDGTETKVSSGKDTDGVDLPVIFTLSQLPDNGYSHSVDARRLAFGRYKIKITENGNEANVLQEERIYIHNELAAQDVLAIVDIVYDTANDKAYQATENYNIHFESKRTLWKYYLVNKNNRIDFTSGDTIAVSDKGAVDPSKPYIMNTFNLSGLQPSATEQVNGMDTVVFLSSVEIPFFEDPKLDIQLLKKPGDSKLIAHLPNPQISGNVKKEGVKAASEIYVFF